MVHSPVHAVERSGRRGRREGTLKKQERRTPKKKNRSGRETGKSGVIKQKMDRIASGMT